MHTHLVVEMVKRYVVQCFPSAIILVYSDYTELRILHLHVHGYCSRNRC